jgi:hypothetical protein
VTEASDLLCERVAANLGAYIDGALQIDVVMVDFEGAAVVGTSPSARPWVTPGAVP